MPVACAVDMPQDGTVDGAFAPPARECRAPIALDTWGAGLPVAPGGLSANVVLFLDRHRARVSFARPRREEEEKPGA